jgi:hypothetical protein
MFHMPCVRLNSQTVMPIVTPGECRFIDDASAIWCAHLLVCVLISELQVFEAP